MGETLTEQHLQNLKLKQKEKKSELDRLTDEIKSMNEKAKAEVEARKVNYAANKELRDLTKTAIDNGQAVVAVKALKQALGLTQDAIAV